MLDELGNRAVPEDQADAAEATQDDGITGAILELRSIDLSSLYEAPPVEISAIDLAELHADPRPPRSRSRPSSCPGRARTRPDVLRHRTCATSSPHSPRSVREPERVTPTVTPTTSSSISPSPRPSSTSPTHPRPSPWPDLDDDPVDGRFSAGPTTIGPAPPPAATSGTPPMPSPIRHGPRRPAPVRPAGRTGRDAPGPGPDPRRDRPVPRHPATSRLDPRPPAVRTATRARPWAKHDEQVTIEVAVTLVDAFVTRSDVWPSPATTR